LCPPRYNVEDQLRDPISVLSFYRRLIAVRRQSAALHRGDYTTLPSPPDVFSWRRSHGTNVVDIHVNMGLVPRNIETSGSVLIFTRDDGEGEAVDGPLTLHADEAVMVASSSA
jgi:alpha-glucosidase